LSGHGVTKYEDARPVEFVSLGDWDVERRQFNELKDLQFFKKFRKWKSLKKWIAILSRQKIKRISDVLSENLFFLHSEYRSILLAHHNICYDIEQFKCLYVPTEPLTIGNFRKEQEKKKNSLIYSLKQCSQ
jgi:dynein heavy chain, axonemal